LVLTLPSKQDNLMFLHEQVVKDDSIKLNQMFYRICLL